MVEFSPHDQMSQVLAHAELASRAVAEQEWVHRMTRCRSVHRAARRRMAEWRCRLCSWTTLTLTLRQGCTVFP